jgi:spermidine/putrescine transport system substrate-binding protein
MAQFAVFAGAGEKGELHIYTWSDYFDQGVIEKFEEQYSCRIAIDYFDSNEAMYAKLKVGGGVYDIITPSSYMSAIMWRQGLVMDLDTRFIPNIENIDKNFLSLTEDPKMIYSVPYTRTVTGVGYNSVAVPKTALGSWGIFANRDFASRMTMLNDMRETIGAGLKFLGYSLNSVNPAEIVAASETVIGWKRNLAKFDVDDAKIGLGSGEFLITHAYNGDVALIMEENPDVGFFVPKEGTSIASDDFVILANSPSIRLAHSFINYMLDSDVALANMEGIRYFMPNPKAVERLDPDLRDNPAFKVDDQVIAKCEVIRDLEQHNALYIQAWDRIKAAE